MKKFRIVYWIGSMTTEVFVKADSEENAIAMFSENKDKDRIVNIEEVI